MKYAIYLFIFYITYIEKIKIKIYNNFNYLKGA